MHGNATHLDTNSREYKTWIHLRRKRRADTCERWKSYSSFLYDMGRCPDGLVIGRLDATKLYGPDNAAWMDRQDMMRRARAART